MGFDSEASSSSHTLLSPSGSSCPILQPKPRLSSQPKTFANVFIAIVGAGVLGLPYTFCRTGWLAGVIMLIVVGALTYHCMMLLVRTRRKLEVNYGFTKIASFGDLGFAAAGPIGRASVDVMIVLSQAGFCVGYLIFIANTLAHLFKINPTWTLSPKSIYVWAMFPFQLGLNSIKSLTHLAPLSIFADIVDIGAMGVVMVEDIAIYAERHMPLQTFNGFSVLLYGLGVAVYAFEGIGMVVPLEQEAEHKDKFGFTLGLSMAIISITYALFGALGYFAFGEETSDIITTNFGTGLVTVIVQLGLCVNLFFTMPIMMHPVNEVAERWFNGKNYCIWLRWVLIVIVSLVATSVPNFTDFLSLVGSSVCILLGFVIPALFHLKVFGDELSWSVVTSDIAIVIVGLVFAVSGTWTSLQEIMSAKV